MPRTLYVTYTKDDLLHHAREAINAVRAKGWVVIDSAELGFAHDFRLDRAARSRSSRPSLRQGEPGHIAGSARGNPSWAEA